MEVSETNGICRRCARIGEIPDSCKLIVPFAVAPLFKQTAVSFAGRMNERQLSLETFASETEGICGTMIFREN
jgi:hypothetical protein